MYNPKTAEQDLHNVVIAALLVALLISGYFCYSLSSTGLKYKILSDYGTYTQSKIAKVDSEWQLELGELLHNTYGAFVHSEYTFVFTDANGETIRAILTLEDDIVQDEKTKKWRIRQLFEQGQSTGIV